MILTTFTQHVMTDSRSCAYFQIYLLSICLLYVCFYLIHAIGVLQQVFDYPSYSYEEWPLTSLKFIAYVTIVMLIMTMLINTRLKNPSYLLMGTLLLLTLIVVVPATGQVFREYKKITDRYTLNCAEELGHIDYEYLAVQGCSKKYHYREDSPKDCGSRFDDCFESVGELRRKGVEQKRYITTVWEESLYPKANIQPRVAALKSQCCGIVVNIYTRPNLKVGALSLTYIIFLVLICCFLYSNSTYAPQKDESSISETSKNILMTIFFVLLLIGFIYTGVGKDTSNMIRRDTVVVDRLITIKESHPSITNHEYNKCTAFKYFEEESLINTEYKPTVFSDINVEKASNQYCDKCNKPDLLIVISSVSQDVAGNCPSDFRFDYPIPKNKKLHLIPSSLAQPLFPDNVCFDPATKHTRCTPCGKFFGVSGDQFSVINYIRNEVKACNRQGLKFVVQAYQVNSQLFSDQDSSEITSFKQNTKQKLGQDNKLKKTLIHVVDHNKNLNGPRILASLKYHTIELQVRDIVKTNYVDGADVKLYESYEQQNTCNPGSSAKLIYTGQSNEQGLIGLDFVYTQLPTTRYTVHVSKEGYSINCRTFTINEKRKYLDVSLSQPLTEHQIRFVLEWGSESKLDNSSDLDLYLTSNSESDKWICYSSYFSSQCAGSVYHGDAKGEQITSESITIQKLGQTKYLVFYKLPIVSPSKGIVDNSVVTELKPIVKVFTYGQDRPTQVSVFDEGLDKSTYADYEKNFKYANLAWCINGLNSEIVKNAQGFTYSVSWGVSDPDNYDMYDLPLSSQNC